MFCYSCTKQITSSEDIVSAVDDLNADELNQSTRSYRQEYFHWEETVKEEVIGTVGKENQSCSKAFLVFTRDLFHT